MFKIFYKILDWLLKNSVQRVLAGAGLSVVSYLAVLTAIQTAFYSLVNNVNSISADLLQLLGLSGVDKCLSAFISVAVFLLTLNSGKLAIRKK
ncbi:DUF2523 family protein [Acinetobacter qingfengensis]|uniref:DUF2523 domain-containing protein n=1 Tax=Acinetobacter qingfengensis TaxID=1262585 RepID=A0A1E7QZQ6_9GAMM|nr:DUF2523 family protein [Acinetobacter qingfengensis]OEY92540.1 hypothetical protein BJI46_14550 [Acinetobacter qingfengensis]